LKLEPWLQPRLDHHTVKIWPTAQLVSCQQIPQGQLEVTLDVARRSLISG
jgi:hypothetical protein